MWLTCAPSVGALCLPGAQSPRTGMPGPPGPVALSPPAGSPAHSACPSPGGSQLTLRRVKGTPASRASAPPAHALASSGLRSESSNGEPSPPTSPQGEPHPCLGFSPRTGLRFLLLSTSGLPWWLRWERMCLQCRRLGFDPWVRKIPGRRQGHPTPGLLPGESHGRRSLVGCCPWGCKESDTTE